MMLRTLGFRVSERRLIGLLGAASRRGTWPDDWSKLASVFPVAVEVGGNLSLRLLEARRQAGWQQTLLVTADVPHYVVYLGREGRDVLVHDPWEGPVQRIAVRKFLSHWQVDDIWSPARIFHSQRWAVALRGNDGA
jgi:hypothetical protein